MNSTRVSAASSPSYSITSSSVKMKMLSDSSRPGERERMFLSVWSKVRCTKWPIWPHLSYIMCKGRKQKTENHMVLYCKFRIFQIIIRAFNFCWISYAQRFCSCVYLISLQQPCRALHRWDQLRYPHHRTHRGPVLQAEKQRHCHVNKKQPFDF